MATQHEQDAMRLAIALSARGVGTTSPNPPVGCVILDADGEIAGTGYHERKGSPHAEAYALEAAGGRARGGTAVVTLEPCNHIGRTPACRQALLDAKISRVVIAHIDPTSRGEGGAAVLRAADLHVEVGVLADEARLVLGNWLDSQAKRRPIVTAAYAHTRHGPSHLDQPQLTALRGAFDAVLLDGARLEEGTPDSHGAGSFELPVHLPHGEPTQQLRSLFEGGARTLLLVDAAGLPSGWNGIVDRLLIYVAPNAPAISDSHPAQLVPQGFRLKNVSVETRLVRIECISVR